MPGEGMCLVLVHRGQLHAECRLQIFSRTFRIQGLVPFQYDSVIQQLRSIDEGRAVHYCYCADISIQK